MMCVVCDWDFFNLFYYFMCISVCLHVRTIYVLNAHEGQKWVSDPPELELETIVSRC